MGRTWSSPTAWKTTTTALSRELTDLVVHANIAVRDLGYKLYRAGLVVSGPVDHPDLRGQWHYGSVYLGDASKGAFSGVKNRVAGGQVTYEDVCACPAS